MRKLFGATIAAAFLAAACGGSTTSPTTPSTQAPTSATADGSSQGDSGGSGGGHGSQPAPPTTTPSPQPPQPEPQPHPDPERELTGVMAGLTGSASSFQFTVGSTLVKGDATTVLTAHGDTPATFTVLKNGVTVEVNGVQAAGFVQASRVHIAENEPPDNDDNDEMKVEGLLGAITGTCPAISSRVAGAAFTTSASTRFDDPCSAFHAGDRVEVRGTKTASGSLAATRLRLRH